MRGILYSLLNIIRMIKPRSMKGAGPIAHTGRPRIHTGLWWERQRKETIRET
jgi:hypothetical protein